MLIFTWEDVGHKLDSLEKVDCIIKIEMIINSKLIFKKILITIYVLFLKFFSMFKKYRSEMDEPKEK